MNSGYYCDVNDVMKIGGFKKGTAYRVIREINKDLKSKGYLTFQGKVSRQALFEKLGIREQTDTFNEFVESMDGDIFK